MGEQEKRSKTEMVPADTALMFAPWVGPSGGIQGVIREEELIVPDSSRGETRVALEFAGSGRVLDTRFVRLIDTHIPEFANGTLAYAVSMRDVEIDIAESTKMLPNTLNRPRPNT
jgi:hypothetical protein